MQTRKRCVYVVSVIFFSFVRISLVHGSKCLPQNLWQALLVSLWECLHLFSHSSFKSQADQVDIYVLLELIICLIQAYMFAYYFLYIEMITYNASNTFVLIYYWTYYYNNSYQME